MTPVHPFDALETLVAQGRIRQWTVERKPMQWYVEVEYLEYDEDNPKGVSNAERAWGRTLAEAVQAVADGLPAVGV